jgi:cytochrome P450/nitrite reductase/ring-hydroxylating ferredoxin subunit
MVAPYRPAPSPVADGYTRLAAVDELRGDGPFPASVDGVDLVVVRARGELRVYEGRCPHQGALLAEGELDGGALVCRNHGWRFDAATGARHGGKQCLRACPSQVADGALWARAPQGNARVIGRATTSGALAPAPRTTIAELPGPRGLALVGNAMSLEPSAMHLTLERWARKFGSTFQVKLGRKTFVVTTEPDKIEPALRARPEAFRRDARFEPIFRELGVDGVFAAEGRAWRPQRRLAMEALSQRNLRGFYPTLARVAERLRGRWERAADTGAEVDILDDLMRFTVDVTTALVFGHDLDTLGGGRDVIQRHLEQFFPAFARRIRAVVPWWRFVRFPADRRTDRAIVALRAWLGELVARARAELVRDPGRATRPANFLEAMLTARDDSGQPFSDDVIFANAVTMLLAGEDTTATSLAWAIHHMLEAPDEVALLRAELTEVLGDSAVPADLETASRLERAAAVANEAMRLRPVAPVLFLDANEDIVLDGLELPRGTGLIGLIRIAATDARHFAAPEAFRPGRWITAGADGSAHDPSVHVPFGSGPRICPGRTLAMLEMRVALATLYQSFDVERVGDASAVRELFSFTMTPQRVRVKLRRRVLP